MTTGLTFVILRKIVAEEKGESERETEMGTHTHTHKMRDRRREREKDCRNIKQLNLHFHNSKKISETVKKKIYKPVI